MLQCKYFSVNKVIDYINKVEFIIINFFVIRNEE